MNRKYLEEPCVWVESNTTTLSILSSHAEIGLGFLLIISLFSWDSQRYFFFLFQSLWFFFFSFHSYVFVCVCSWCLLDSNIIYLQVAAQHNTNFHVLAGSLHFSSIIYRDLLFFFPLIFGLWRLCVNLGTVVSRTWWLFFYFDSYWSSCIMPPWLPVTTIVYGLRLEWLLIHSSAAMPRSCRLQYLLLRDGGSGRKEASKEKERGRDAKDEFH